MLVFASTKAISFATTLVLARILVPADFGLVALASATIGVLSLFSDLGLSGTLVVRKQIDDRFGGTVLTLMLIMGAATALVIAAASPLAALIFDQPRLTPILAVLGSTVLLGVPTWFFGTILQRELEFWRRFGCLLAQSLTYAATAISAALAGAGVWSLVIGQISATLVYALALYVTVPYRVRPAFDRRAAREAVREGHGFLAQAAIGFIEMRADHFAVGGFLGAAPLGNYSMALRLGELPYWAITESVAKVTFPGFARMHHRGESVTGSFLSVLRLVTLVACPMGVLLSATAEPFTLVVLGSEWLPMVGALSVLGIWGTFNHVEASLGWLMNSLGKAGLNAAISAVAVVPLIGATILAALLGGITTVAWVMLAHVVASMIVRMVLADRRLSVPVRAQLRTVQPVAWGALVAWIAARSVAEAIGLDSAVVALVVSLLAGGTAYAAVISLADPKLIPWSASQLRRILGAAPSS